MNLTEAYQAENFLITPRTYIYHMTLRLGMI